MLHYDCGSRLYGINHAEGHLFRKIGDNRLLNEFGAKVLSKLHKFQNMKCFQVHEDIIIAVYVRHRTTLHDGTVAYRFSKELLAFLETLVAFSPTAAFSLQDQRPQSIRFRGYLVHRNPQGLRVPSVTAGTLRDYFLRRTLAREMS